MRRYLNHAALGLGILLASTVTMTAHALKPGDMAPDFSLPGSDCKTYQLSDYRGKQAVVLSCFPNAYTCGCTIECQSSAETGHKIRCYDQTYFKASLDPLKESTGFAQDTGADFPLLSDHEKTVAQDYDVLHEKGYAMRHTYYIDIDGKILYIDEDITPETSAEDMIANLERLNVKKK